MWCLRCSIPFLLAWNVVGPAQTSTSTIRGKVLTETNALVPSAYVTLVKSGLPPATLRVQAGADGAFQASPPVPGTYRLCVQVPGGAMIDPCEWDSSLQSVTVTAGQSLSGIVIVVKTASVVKLRIQDSAGLLSLKTKDGRDPQILAGVWTGGGTVPLPDGKAMALPSGTFHPARLVGKDSGGANYEVAIPNDTPLRLHVMSPDLKLADAKGAAVSNNGARVAFQHKSGDATIPAFSFTVTGAAR